MDYCRRHNIVVQAYCPLVRGERLDDPVLQEVAKETARTPAQVLVRWSLQKGFGENCGVANRFVRKSLIGVRRSPAAEK